MDYKEILNELGCEIIRASTEEKIGLYISELNLIFLSESLDDIELENFTLHETAHALSGDTLTRLSAPQLKIVQEARANRAMKLRNGWRAMRISQTSSMSLHFLNIFIFQTHFMIWLKMNLKNCFQSTESNFESG